ncbi:SDR family NAD(P)-dependent oxidoreductase [Dyadobacter sp. LHD-138]|uniref:SDR family oxidoreductase n=1 Tax=Dyadobacter sp. LHD-138 TaxID=3071413 RepID=UPI0027DFF40D|nr:SDR family NAD(P)-dependent oxidoreductase [Dyadobacter sp. LHD-138]MDQ6480174.1 SDR family NAD(P)-dependent oxidoreductase [Dyadobacter sp. LHD-138]
MALTNNTILITGGSSGIGLEMARQFIASKNRVIICSRSLEKLHTAKKLLPELIIYQCDISNPEALQHMADWLVTGHSDLNILINNAAVVHRTNFAEETNLHEKFATEIATNLLAPASLAHMLYPVLLKHPNAKIINITTGLVYTPRADYLFYNATKAALHSFSQVLRHQLRNEPVKIIEVLFPVVDTPWHKGNTPKMAISPQRAVEEMISKLEKNPDEIRIGAVKLLYFLSKIAPKFAFKKINSLS